MTEANTDATDESTDPTNRRPSTSRANSTDLEIRTNLYRGALGLFVLLAVVAVVQLYTSVGAAINTFVAAEYRPLFRAAFNLVVLLVAGIGISWSVRKLAGE